MQWFDLVSMHLLPPPWRCCPRPETGAGPTESAPTCGSWSPSDERGCTQMSGSTWARTSSSPLSFAACFCHFNISQTQTLTFHSKLRLRHLETFHVRYKCFKNCPRYFKVKPVRVFLVIPAVWEEVHFDVRAPGASVRPQRQVLRLQHVHYELVTCFIVPQLHLDQKK